MKHGNSILVSGVVFSIMTTFWPVTTLEESHGDTLRDSKWDRMLGTWIDPETRGRITKNT